MRRDKEKCCGTCKYHKMDIFDDGWVCNNEEAEGYLEETDYNDSCMDWEERP